MENKKEIIKEHNNDFQFSKLSIVIHQFSIFN